jgi:hypothetical protein
MAAHEMADPLKHLDTDLPFATIGDDTMTAPEILADILKNKSL